METLNLSGPVNQHLFRWNDSFAVAVTKRTLVTSPLSRCGLGTWQRIDSLGQPFPPTDLGSIIKDANGNENYAANFNPVSIRELHGLLFITLDRDVEASDIVDVPPAGKDFDNQRIVWPEMNESEEGFIVSHVLHSGDVETVGTTGYSESWKAGTLAFSCGFFVGTTEYGTLGRFITLINKEYLTHVATDYVEQTNPPSTNHPGMTKELAAMGYTCDPDDKEMVKLGAISIPKMTPATEIQKTILLAFTRLLANSWGSALGEWVKNPNSPDLKP